MDLVNDLESKMQEANELIDILKEKGEELAKAEKNYKIKLRIVALGLKNGQGMAVTLIDKVVYGVPEVAELRQKRDIAEANYKWALEKLNLLKLQIRIIENQIEREFNQ